MTRGRDTSSSYPSRRIVSIKIERCNSPRPETLKPSCPSISSTLMPTFVMASCCKRSRIWRDVRNRPPSRPANGPVLCEKFMEMVGSSTLMLSNASGFAADASVSPTFTSSTPAIETISPASALSASTRFKPRYVRIFVTLLRLTSPPRFTSAICSPSRTLPCTIRPVASRPT